HFGRDVLVLLQRVREAFERAGLPGLLGFKSLTYFLAAQRGQLLYSAAAISLVAFFLTAFSVLSIGGRPASIVVEIMNSSPAFWQWDRLAVPIVLAALFVLSVVNLIVLALSLTTLRPPGIIGFRWICFWLTRRYRQTPIGAARRLAFGCFLVAM